jgi:hypothetical protein
VKGLVAAAIAVVALMLGPGSAIAAPTIVTEPQGFVLSSSTCPNLPPGTTLTGDGTRKSITSERTDRNGVTTVMDTTHTRGTATDQDGNAYVFLYSNEFRVSNTPTDPGTFTGLMTDHFTAAGPGPARLSNGFTATFTTDFATFFLFDPIRAFGDPIGFPNGEAHCDPL